MMYHTAVYNIVLFYVMIITRTVAFPMTIASVITTDPGISITQDVRILSTNSQRFIRIIGSKVDSLGLRGEENTHLQLESTNIGGTIGVRIKSVKENTYLCVSTSGELVVQANGNTLDRCAFVQDIHTGFTTFQSVYNRAWFLGFKRCGKTKRPDMTTVGQNAARFLEYFS